jgi:ADP-ribose pyrophosphatase YjhB (NUDIX family)
VSSQRRAFSVSIFARHRGKILLIRHRRLERWLPVGGEIEAGETPLEAAARELREETGLEGKFLAPAAIEGGPPGLLGYEEHLAGDKGLHLNFAFVAEVDRDEVISNGEFGDHLWVDDLSAIACPTNVRQLGALALDGGRPPLVRIAERWLEAFNGRDLEALLALYAEDAVHTSPKLRAHDPATGGEIRGKPALRAWWSGALERSPGLRYQTRSLCADAERVWMEYLRINPGEASTLVSEVLEVEAGRIVRSRVYHG